MQGLVLTLEVGQVTLLVEAGLVQTERVDDIDLLLGGVLSTLLGLLSRGVGTGVCAVLAEFRVHVSDGSLRGKAYQRSHHQR